MTERRMRTFLLVFPFIVLLLGMTLTAILYSRDYRQAAHDHIAAFCATVLEKAPESEPQLLAALKEYHAMTGRQLTGKDILKEYGYFADEFCTGASLHVFLFPALLFLAVAGSFALGLLTSRRQERKRIADLTEYLEQVNIGSDGTLIQLREDEFSHLQDEIYKTVTALYQTREAAVSAKQNFADNLANIAHQLKTPITAAFLSLQLMKEKTASAYTNQIERQLERLNRLEESLLMLSKIDAGTLPLKHENVDIYTVLNLAAENLSDLLQKEQITVDIPEKGCVEVIGDTEWTMEALMNLMKNCMEHTQPGGMIHCDYSRNPLYGEIRIWDDGTGFAPEDLPHLFKRFYRGKRAIGNGIGIGLALSRSIIELQNGTIAAYNLRNGGACFEIRVYSH